MRFGEIIKKAWHVTWHYRWLWVLGIFAGITGGSGGGGGSTSSFRQPFTSQGRSGVTPVMPDWGSIVSSAQYWLPFVAIVIVMLFVISIAFAVIGIGARGGLVWAVNEIEEGRKPRLGEAWNAGFARFWSIFGLWLVLVLPLAIAGLVLAALIIVPIAAPLMHGADISPALVIGPACGVLGIGVPLLIVVGLVLGILYITGLRFVVIYNMGTLQAVGEAWRAFRHRLGDHVLMYLISVGLSIVAGLALAVPILIVAVPTIVPAIVAATRGTWGLFAGMIALFTVLVVVLSIAFTAVWGTFTSAMWTIFFRRLTGREVLVAIPAAYPPPPGVSAPQAVPVAPAAPAAAPPAPMRPPQDAPDA